MTKKLAQTTAHITPETKLAVMRLADLQGVSVSEFVGDIIEHYLHKRLDELSILTDWADENEKMRSDRSVRSLDTRDAK